MPYTMLTIIILLSCWTALASGICNTACPLIYSPVCGTNGITYGNQCVLESTACTTLNCAVLTVASNGECPAPPCAPGCQAPDICINGACQPVCGNTYDPVCGPDQVTYNNQCELEVAFCGDQSVTGTPGVCPGGGSGDPHMLAYINGVKQPICFDYYGNNKDVIQLIQDDSLGLTVDGELFAKTRSAKTFFKSIGVSTELCSLKASFDDLSVSGKKLPWYPTSEWIECGSETQYRIESEHQLEVKTVNGVEVTVEKAIKVTKHNVTFEHVNVFIRNQDHLSSSVKGVIGQFTNLQGELVTSEDGDSGVIVFPDSQRRYPISVQLRRKRRPLSKQQFNCWFVEDAVMLIGSFEEYKIL